MQLTLPPARLLRLPVACRACPCARRPLLTVAWAKSNKAVQRSEDAEEEALLEEEALPEFGEDDAHEVASPEEIAAQLDDMVFGEGYGQAVDPPGHKAGAGGAPGQCGCLAQAPEWLAWRSRWRSRMRLLSSAQNTVRWHCGRGGGGVQPGGGAAPLLQVGSPAAVWHTVGPLDACWPPPACAPPTQALSPSSASPTRARAR